MRARLLLALVACLAAGPAFGLSGAPDPTFGGGDGKVSFHHKNDDWIDDVAIQKDGKIVAVGQTDENFVLAALRLLPNGDLDPSFGTGGKFLTAVMRHAHSVALQDDGGILLSGTMTGEELAVMRLTSSGKLDKGFGEGGVAALPISPHGRGTEVAVQPDGRIVVAGNAGDDPADLVAVGRLLPDGTPDTSFGNGGTLELPIAAEAVAIEGLAILPNRKIALAGYAEDAKGKLSVLAVVVNGNGTPDAAFGPGGARKLSLGSGSSIAVEVLAYPTDRLLLACRSRNGSGQQHFTLVLLGPNGLVEDSEITDQNVHQEANAAAVRPDGRIVVAGTWGSAFGVNQYLPSLELDPSFGDGGVAKLDFGGGFDTAYAVAVQADGNVVAAGIAQQDLQSLPDFAVARFVGIGERLLADDFGNGVPSWTPVSGAWSEAGGFLSGSSDAVARADAPATWLPSNDAGCSQCTVVASVGHVAAGTRSKLTLTAWQESPAEQVQVVYTPRNGKWMLLQKGNGATARRRVKWPISPLYSHHVAVAYDGSHLGLSIDGTLLARMPAIAVPRGNVTIRMSDGAVALREIHAHAP
jgi:uncharacterized delta-60 repeat protein